MLYIFLWIVITLLVFTNAITDAPNAICTLVGTKVMEFKKAARLSANFNFLGIVVMSFINISVANCISSMVDLNDGTMGMMGLAAAIFVVVAFSLIAMLFGNPTSETHGLVAGLTGSAIALYGVKSVNWNEWVNVGIGLIWSIIGTFIISYAVSKIFKKALNKLSEKKIEQTQIVSACAMSFMHGAQDGQKFIGILIILSCIMRKRPTPQIIEPTFYIWAILFVAVVMWVGARLGGRKIVEKVGSGMVELNKEEALFSDLTTFLTLLIASINGIPVSTTHAKTVSILGVAKSNNAKAEKKDIVDIIKAWIWTFPVCGGGAYVLTMLAKNFI